jgi:hypothetical protein
MAAGLSRPFFTAGDVSIRNASFKMLPKPLEKSGF